MRPRVRTSVAVSALAVVLAACGGTADVESDPRGALRDAVERMSGWDGAAITLRLDADVAALLAADEADELTEEHARAILDGTVTIKSYAGADLADRTDDEGELLVETGGTTLPPRADDGCGTPLRTLRGPRGDRPVR